MNPETLFFDHAKTIVRIYLFYITPFFALVGTLVWIAALIDILQQSSWTRAARIGWFAAIGVTWLLGAMAYFWSQRKRAFALMAAIGVVAVFLAWQIFIWA